jgi:hypothetical protein
MTPQPLGPHSVGLAGEHYVAMRIAMAGATPALLPARTPTADLIATHDGRATTIQIKTMGAAGRYMVDIKPERMAKPDFLVIVELNRPGGNYGGTVGEPTAYVLPRKVALEVWAAGGDNHPTRPALNLRKARHLLTGYAEAWHLIAESLGLGLEAAA